MSKATNPTLIGAFVIGAIALLVIAVLLFGGTELLTRKALLVSYFPDSVKGLREGSNVLLRGVRVGYVKEIHLQGRIDKQQGTLDTLVEVIMEVQPETFALFEQGERLEEITVSRLPTRQFVDAGFRAQLGIDSFVTGQLLVELDFKPDTQAVFRGEDTPYPEVPTIPSEVQRVLERVQNFVARLSTEIDATQLLHDIQDIAAGLNELANSEDLREALAGLNALANSDAPALIRTLDASATKLEALLEETRTLVRHVDGEIDPLVDEIVPTVRRLRDALAAGEATLAAASSQIRTDSELAIETSATLAELRSAARALTVLLDYVDRHPEALLRGKRQP